jgi:hypothetical protein
MIETHLSIAAVGTYVGYVTIAYVGTDGGTSVGEVMMRTDGYPGMVITNVGGLDFHEAGNQVVGTATGFVTDVGINPGNGETDGGVGTGATIDDGTYSGTLDAGMITTDGFPGIGTNVTVDGTHESGMMTGDVGKTLVGGMIKVLIGGRTVAGVGTETMNLVEISGVISVYLAITALVDGNKKTQWVYGAYVLGTITPFVN